MPEIVPVPGKVTGSDIEGQADELAAAAARLADLLADLTREPRRSMDVIAVFRRLSETSASMETAAAELLGEGLEPGVVEPALTAGVLDLADTGESVRGLVQQRPENITGAAGQALAADEQLGQAPVVTLPALRGEVTELQTATVARARA